MSKLSSSEHIYEHMVKLRRTFHRHPELAFEEEQTARIIMEELERLDIPYQYDGVVGRLACGISDAPVVALRAEMDALPGAENTDLPFVSSIESKMHTLGSCLTSTLVYHAAVRGIHIDAVESSYTGDMDVRGLFGMSDDVRKGFNQVTIEMKVKSEASAEELTELAMFSPVYDIISRALPVHFKLTAY